MSYKLIATTTLGSAGTITFSGIPQTYTDLWLLISARSSNGGYGDFSLNLDINGSPAKSGRGFAAQPFGSTYALSFPSVVGSVLQASESAQFSNVSVRLFQYTTSAPKLVYSEDAGHFFSGGLLSASTIVMNQTGAITSITLSDGAVTNFVTNSRASLYGILQGSGGATVSTT
jgi:hypothetical protein